MTVSLQQGSARPPYVQFEERSEEYRPDDQNPGHIQFRSVDYVVIRQIGAKDSVEKEATAWLEGLSHNQNYDPVWVDHFRTQYMLWKKGQEPTPVGMHIKQWAAISKAQADMLLAVNIRTVEDLAVANEQALLRVGIGARDLQNKAKAWLQTAEDTGKTASEIASLRAKNEGLEHMLHEMQKKLDALANRRDAIPVSTSGGTGFAGALPSTSTDNEF